MKHLVLVFRLYFFTMVTKNISSNKIICTRLIWHILQASSSLFKWIQAYCKFIDVSKCIFAYKTSISFNNSYIPSYNIQLLFKFMGIFSLKHNFTDKIECFVIWNSLTSIYTYIYYIRFLWNLIFHNKIDINKFMLEKCSGDLYNKYTMWNSVLCIFIRK